MTRNSTDLRNTLLEGYVTPSSMYDGKYTKTTQFLLPSIGINLKNELLFKFYVNAYINDVMHEHEYERPIFVLFSVKNFKDKSWEKVSSALTLSASYINDYDCGKQDENNLIMFVFRTPDEYANDYYNFKRGHYSKFSSVYKDKFPKFVVMEDGKTDSKESIIWKIINKSEDLMEELAAEFVAKREDGSFYKESDFKNMLATLKSADEIWDRPRKEREYYRYTKQD